MEFLHAKLFIGCGFAPGGKLMVERPPFTQRGNGVNTLFTMLLDDSDHFIRMRARNGSEHFFFFDRIGLQISA
jgi:hypothetical protein